MKINDVGTPQLTEQNDYTFTDYPMYTPDRSNRTLDNRETPYNLDPLLKLSEDFKPKTPLKTPQKLARIISKHKKYSSIEAEYPQQQNILDYAIADVNIERIQKKNIGRLASLEKTYS